MLHRLQTIKQSNENYYNPKLTKGDKGVKQSRDPMLADVEGKLAPALVEGLTASEPTLSKAERCKASVPLPAGTQSDRSIESLDLDDAALTPGKLSKVAVLQSAGSSSCVQDDGDSVTAAIDGRAGSPLQQTDEIAPLPFSRSSKWLREPSDVRP